MYNLITGGPDVVFDYKTMCENTLKIALNSTCMKDSNKNVLPYVYLALFLHSCGSGVGLKPFRRVFLFDVVLPLKRNEGSFLFRGSTTSKRKTRLNSFKPTPEPQECKNNAR